MAIAKLSSKSQIVIPAEVRRELGIEPGDTLKVEVDGHRIVITKENAVDALERLRSLGTGRWREMEEEIERSRAEWDGYSRGVERAMGFDER